VQSDAAQDVNNIIKLWTNIINSITSPPTKAFFAGVAKLVEIKNNKIILGFLSDNLINQAKTPSKITPLENAVNTIAKGYNIEFIKIDSNTQTLNIKPKINPVSTPAYNPVKPQTAPVQDTSKAVKEDSSETDEDDEEKKRENKQYSPEVRDMLEQYNGRIIE